MTSPAKVFTVELTEAELLQAWLMAKRNLDATCKDIRRGRGVEADAETPSLLYSTLSAVVYARLSATARKGGGK